MVGTPYSFYFRGLDLENSWLSHGQLLYKYVACLRIGKLQGVFIYAENGEIKNIFHESALQKYDNK